MLAAALRRWHGPGPTAATTAATSKRSAPLLAPWAQQHSQYRGPLQRIASLVTALPRRQTSVEEGKTHASTTSSPPLNKQQKKEDRPRTEDIVDEQALPTSHMLGRKHNVAGNCADGGQQGPPSPQGQSDVPEAARGSERFLGLLPHMDRRGIDRALTALHHMYDTVLVRKRELDERLLYLFTTKTKIDSYIEWRDAIGNIDQRHHSIQETISTIERMQERAVKLTDERAQAYREYEATMSEEAGKKLHEATVKEVENSSQILHETVHFLEYTKAYAEEKRRHDGISSEITEMWSKLEKWAPLFFILCAAAGIFKEWSFRRAARAEITRLALENQEKEDDLLASRRHIQRQEILVKSLQYRLDAMASDPSRNDEQVLEGAHERPIDRNDSGAAHDRRENLQTSVLLAQLDEEVGRLQEKNSVTVDLGWLWALRPSAEEHGQAETHSPDWYPPSKQITVLLPPTATIINGALAIIALSAIFTTYYGG